MKPKPLDLDGFEKEIRKKAYDREFGKSVSDVVPVVHPIVDLEDVIKMLKEIKQRIKQACEFYLRYKDKPELLMKEHSEYSKDYDKFSDEFGLIFKLYDNKEAWEHFIDEYNEWLFKLSFKGVLGGKNANKKD